MWSSINNGCYPQHELWDEEKISVLLSDLIRVDLTWYGKFHCLHRNQLTCSPVSRMCNGFLRVHRITLSFLLHCRYNQPVSCCYSLSTWLWRLSSLSGAFTAWDPFLNLPYVPFYLIWNLKRGKQIYNLGEQPQDTHIHLTPSPAQILHFSTQW